MTLTIVFTIAGYTFEFSVGFKRTSPKWDIDDSLELIDRLVGEGVTSVYGTMDEDGNFVPEGVAIPDPEQ